MKEQTPGGQCSPMANRLWPANLTQSLPLASQPNSCGPSPRCRQTPTGPNKTQSGLGETVPSALVAGQAK